MVSPDSLIVTELEKGIFIEVFLKESSPSALGGQGCCLQSWECLNAACLFPYETRSSVVKAQSPATPQEGLMPRTAVK